MKSLKMLAMILVLTVLPWAQTSTPNNAEATAQSKAKTECPCCQKMADAKDGKSCCAHHDMAAKDGEAMSCCSKDGKSCMKGDKKEMAACAKAGCCAEGKDCCKKEGDKSAMACCSGGQCGMHHDAAPDAMK